MGLLKFLFTVPVFVIVWECYKKYSHKDDTQ